MSNNFCTFYIARHGETDWNVKRLIQGHSDTTLNKNGEHQAKQLAQKLKQITFHKVFSSDLLRAKKTAEIIALEKKIAIETTQALRERTFGKYEGLHISALEGLDDILKKLDRKKRFSYKHADEVESDEELIGRLIPFLRQVSAGNHEKNILIVSHGGVIRALLRHFDPEQPANMHVENAAYIKILSDGVGFELKEKSGISYE